MCTADELISKIAGLSRIPSVKRRQAILRELRAHIEDVRLAARESHHRDDQIESLVLANFGDPNQIAREFAWVYRHEWAIFRISVFALSILAVGSLVSATVLSMQAGVAIGFGVPLVRILASRHTVIEILDILSTVGAYLGLVSLEKVFHRYPLQKAIGTLTAIIAAAIALCAAGNARAPFLVFGLVNGIFFRATQVCIGNRNARTCVTAACFALAGFISVQLRPSSLHSAIALNCASWLVMWAGYQLMATVAVRIEGALFKGLERI